MFVICLIISYKYTNNLPISQLFLYFSYPELTLLDQIQYKRFAIRSAKEYSVFYLQDKLNIPYSFNKKAEEDYAGTITRIDTYNIQDDKFISITLNSMSKIQRQFYNNLSNNFFKYKRHEKI